MLPGVRFNQNTDTETLDKMVKNIITLILTNTYHYMLCFFNYYQISLAKLPKTHLLRGICASCCLPIG